MWLPWAAAAVLLPAGTQGWSSPFSWSSSEKLHAAAEGNETNASHSVEGALRERDKVRRAAALYESTNEYLETLTENVAKRIKCQMCLRAGEWLAERTREVKDEIELIDEVANICRGTEMAEDGGWIGQLQDEGWEIHNESLVQVVDEAKRTTSENRIMIESWMLRRSCSLVFHADFEFTKIAEFLALVFVKNETAEKADTTKTQMQLCLKMTGSCLGANITKRDRYAIPVARKAKPRKAAEEDAEQLEDPDEIDIDLNPSEAATSDEIDIDLGGAHSEEL